MFNRRMFVSTAIFVMLFFLLCVVSAKAHTFTIVPDLKIHQVPVGSEYTAKLTNTEAFLYPDYYRVSADVLFVRFLYKDETETVFPDYRQIVRACNIDVTKLPTFGTASDQFDLTSAHTILNLLDLHG